MKIKHVQTPVDVGNVIREARQAAGLDQGSLARKVRVSRQWLVEVEKGKPRAEVGLILRTLKILGIVLRAEPWVPGKADEIDAVIDRARGKSQ